MNNRAIVIAIIFIYLVLLTFVASVLGIENSTILVDGVYYQFDEVWSYQLMGSTFFDLLTFDVELPFIVTLFLVYPPLLVMIWYIAELIRGV